MQDEIIYHVFQRSFYDSNGDKHGDFRGLELKLDYIQNLGATSILILPTYESDFHHNYFASDFRKIDPSYGDMDDYISLIRSIHSRGMKLYLDMEVQYITEDHLWYKDSYGNPDSVFSEHIIYNGPKNTEPESIIFDLNEIQSYDGTVKKVACLDILNPNTQEEIYKEFQFWTDPLGDGSLKYGADGFRLDHMMDDLDDKGKIVNVYRDFWYPLIQRVRALNPEIKFIGEQANWDSHGEKAFTEADVDRMFAFPLKFAISNFSKVEIERALIGGVINTPHSKQQITLLENHDTTRFSSSVNGDPGKLRVGGALQLLSLGIPCIYYGQELGMLGEGGFAAYGISDGNDIPRREAFPWTAKVESEGMALWYKDTGPWWNDSKLRDDDGISVEEQVDDPKSLYSFYRSLIALRRKYSCLQEGTLKIIESGNDYVISFIREGESTSLLILISLSSDRQLLRLTDLKITEVCFKYPKVDFVANQLEPYAIQVFEMERNL